MNQDAFRLWIEFGRPYRYIVNKGTGGTMDGTVVSSSLFSVIGSPLKVAWDGISALNKGLTGDQWCGSQPVRPESVELFFPPTHPFFFRK